jgi:hypothetical protein
VDGTLGNDSILKRLDVKMSEARFGDELYLIERKKIFLTNGRVKQAKLCPSGMSDEHREKLRQAKLGRKVPLNKVKISRSSKWGLGNAAKK